jgi:hypothetical protein
MLPIVTDVLPTMLPFKFLIMNDVTDVTDFSHFYVFSRKGSPAVS